MNIVVFQLAPYFSPDYPFTIQGLRDRGHNVLWGTLNDRGNTVWHDGKSIVHEINGPGDSRLFSGVKKWKSLNQQRKYLDELVDYLKPLNPDVVQFEPGSIRLAWYLSRSLLNDTIAIQDIKQINLGVHNSAKAKVGDWRRMNSIRLRAHRTFDHTLFDYHYVAETVLGDNWRELSSVAPVGIAPSFLTVSHSQKPLAGAQDPVRFAYIGALAKFRELETLLYAAREMIEKTRSFRIDLIGPDLSGGFYRDMIKELGIADNVKIKDPVPYEDIPQILASGYEVGLAYNPIRPTWQMQPTIKVLEYRAIGMPIISSDVLSHRDYVEQDDNGLLVQNSAEAWAGAMLRFVQDRSFLNSCYRSALSKRSGNTIADVARIHEEIYLKLQQKK